MHLTRLCFAGISPGCCARKGGSPCKWALIFACVSEVHCRCGTHNTKRRNLGSWWGSTRHGQHDNGIMLSTK